MSDSGSNYDALNQSLQDSQLHSYHSASDGPDQSSVLSHDRSRSRRRPRKRKTTQNLICSQPSPKRLKSSYNNDYRIMFNATVKELESNRSSETVEMLQESQVGLTVWSSEEKAAFFCSLARRGRQDIQSIATDIGSKSESEVYVYSDMLFKAAVDQQTHETRKKLLGTSDLEAALEVRADCCAALDLAAEALSALRRTEEEAAEKKRHKDLALLTPKTARWVERCIAVHSEGTEEVSRRIPAARLLILLNFLHLSKRFFMNSVTVENNWRSYSAERNKSPSILYTAFSDFHALSISITQRLVQSTLFFAMSRLKAMSASGQYMPRSHVRRRDVTAALHVLGMKSDAKAFWAGVARKCKLRVYDKVRHRHVFGKRYSYLEVERLLCPHRISNRGSPEMVNEDANASMSDMDRSLTVSSANASEDSSLSDSVSTEADGSNSLSHNEDLPAIALDPANKEDGHGRLQDAYLEALDQQASLNEERRLWKMLGNNPAEKMQPVDEKLPKGSVTDRRHNEDLLDWRIGLDYAGDWETHGTLEFRNDFARSQSKDQDANSTGGLAKSKSDPDIFVYGDSAEEAYDSESDEDTDGPGATNDDKANASSANDARR